MNDEHQFDYAEHRPKLHRLFPVKQVPKQPGYEWLTESSLRHWIFNAPEMIGSNGTEMPGNGFGKSIIRIGRKILIDLDELDIWVESNRLS